MSCSRVIAALVVCALGGFAMAEPLGTAFTYQGELRDGDGPANGVYDLRFGVYADAAGPTMVGPVACANNVEVIDGRFTVLLDFGSVFNGEVRFLEVAVRADAGEWCEIGAGYTTLLPRQRVSAAPNAGFAANAATAASAATALSAANATALNNQPATFYTNAGNLTGTLSDARLSTNVTTLAGSQTFSGAKTFSAAPAFSAAGGGAPFTVGSTTRVTNLNADLLDGLDASSFALASHTHDATGIVSGVLNDARLSSNIPRLNGTNTFTGANRFNAFVGVNRGTALTLNEVFGLQNASGGTGYTGMYISSTDASGGRPFYGYSVNNLNAWTYLDAAGFWRLDHNGTRVTVNRTTGHLGIGNDNPLVRLDIAGADAAMRVRNVNDTGGGYVQNTFSTLQLGLFNPGGTAWGVIPAGASRALLGMENSGRVGTLTNTSGQPQWRNTIDDGAGNASFTGRVTAANATINWWLNTTHATVSSTLEAGTVIAGTAEITGTLLANNMPAVKIVTATPSGFMTNGSVTLIESIPVHVPASGYLRISARCRIFLNAYGVFNSTATLELKETTSGEVTIKQVPLGTAGGAPTASGQSFNGDITLDHLVEVPAGARSYKLRLLHNAGTGSDTVSYSLPEVTVMYFPRGL